jgi:AraC family transcriptional regulator of adaptative response / DNA-3-methyladenine glycosylase II
MGRTLTSEQLEAYIVDRYPEDRSSFRAVVTTGIYCRPGCPARPLPENVRLFEFAAAAETAGFRPCRRCRPEREPGPATWVSASELVCRALRRIADGALDEAGEGELAASLGVSARHLRRLFGEHVGASPDAVARSRRAHLARRLLDETNLRVADIAFAAGFASVRQMNRVMQQIFRASPAELRQRRRRIDPPSADGGLELRLPYRPPLAWSAMLAYLRPRAIPGVESIDGTWYRRTIHVDGDPGVVELTDEPHAARLRLRIHLPNLDSLSHLVARARRVFDLDADPATIAAGLSSDPLVAGALQRLPGVRIAGAWDPFELGVRAILGQQVTVGGATTLAGRLVERFGTPVPGLEPMGLTHRFPTPETVAAADLTVIGLPTRRAAAIQSFAASIATGTLRLDASAGLDQTVTQLCTLPGVGQWTAHYIAMRACGERDAFPSGDLGLRRALATESVAPAAADVEARSEAWRPWRAYAAMLLWLEGRSRIDRSPSQ